MSCFIVQNCCMVFACQMYNNGKKKKKFKKKRLKLTVSHNPSRAMATEWKVMVSQAISRKSCSLVSWLAASQAVATLYGVNQFQTSLFFRARKKWRQVMTFCVLKLHSFRYWNCMVSDAEITQFCVLKLHGFGCWKYTILGAEKCWNYMILGVDFT